MSKNKVGLIVDSSVGLTKKEAEKLGLYFVPIIIDYEGKEFESGVDIDNKFLWKNLSKGSKVKTAAIRLSDLTKEVEKASKANEIVYIMTLSSKLSSINDSAKMISKEFDNVHVLESEMTTPWFNAVIKEAVKAIKDGDSEKVKEVMTSQNGKTFGYLLPKTMDLLYAGGRVSKAQYLIGSLAKVNPIIPVIGGSLSDHPALKTRGLSKAIKKSVTMVMDKMKEYNESGIKTKIIVSWSDDKGIYEELLGAIKASGYNGEIIETLLSPAITVHVGPGNVFVGIMVDY